jgi:ABC-type phosphate/phosphonate transport system substrate-binding protein
MAMKNSNPAAVSETPGNPISRRHALAVMLGAGCFSLGSLSAAETDEPVRLAISESLLGDVNLNDARAAMRIWVERMTRDLNLFVNSKLLFSTQEILERIRKGQADAVALNVLEYRQVADLLDSSQIVTSAGDAGLEQYVILVKQNSGIRGLADLKGRKLRMLKAPKMCVAPAWLLSTLEAGHHGPAEQFLGALETESKFSRVILPVFFGQSDACLTSKRGFDTMCELNPQVARDLKVLVSSPSLVVSFYIFRKNYQSLNRGKLIKAISRLRTGAAGEQLATLFQFEALAVRDASCLASALSVLDAAEHARARRGAGMRKG